MSMDGEFIGFFFLRESVIWQNEKKKSEYELHVIFYVSTLASVVTYSQLKTMLANRNIQLFDVRNPDEYQAGRIADAVNIPRKW